VFQFWAATNLPNGAQPNQHPEVAASGTFATTEERTMKSRIATLLSTGAAACAFASTMSLVAPAFAQETFTKDNWPQQFNKRPITLAESQIEVSGEIALGLDKGIEFERIHITPNVYFGVDKNLTIGLSHNYFGSSIGAFALGRSLCLGKACGDFYRNVSPDAKYMLLRGDVQIALHGGLDIGSVDPFNLSVRVGAQFRFKAGDSVFVDADPALVVGINGRDTGARELINVPVRGSFQATKELAPFIETGITAPLDGFSKGFAIPLGVGVNVAVERNIDIGGALRFPVLLNGTEGFAKLDGTLVRELGVNGAFRF
jgi:hypothetical protein